MRRPAFRAVQLKPVRCRRSIRSGETLGMDVGREYARQSSLPVSADTSNVLRHPPSLQRALSNYTFSPEDSFTKSDGILGTVIPRVD